MNSLLAGFVGLVLSAPSVAEPLLEGRVRLDSGELVADAQVRLFDMSDLRQGAVARATTDGTGYFALPLASLGGHALPQGFALGPNYPNPFNPSTIIPYQLAASSAVRLEVFNLLGQRIATLVDGARPAGFHTATWNATDGAGRAVGAGVYIYRMTVGAASQTGRMVLVDGQAGVAASGVASVWSGAAGSGLDGVGAQVYGLIVSGEGLVPYVDSAFRVEAGMAPVELVVSSGSYSAGKVTDDDCALCGLFGAFDDAEEEEEETTEEEADETPEEVPDDAPVTIPDANLRAAIAEALGKASGATITVAEMKTLTRLSKWESGIRDLTGLEFATNLTELWLSGNGISDISALRGLTKLTELWLKGQPLSASSINDHIPALQRNGATVRFDPLLRESDFDIELVFLDDHFDERHKRVIQYAARRWMSIIREDLPDYTFTGGWSEPCGDRSYAIPSGERIDDLRIYVVSFNDDDDDAPAGWASPYVLRETSHLSVVGFWRIRACSAATRRRSTLA